MSSPELIRQLKLMQTEALASAKQYAFRLWASMHPKQRHVIMAMTLFSVLFGGNQTGKSTSAILRVKFHATGIYPDGWDGRRTNRGQDIWFAGDRWTTLRDSIQVKMFGKDMDHPGRYVEGMEPPIFTEEDIVPGSWRKASEGALETVKVYHVSGGITTITFKTYHMGLDGVASATIDGIVIDEECGFAILQELIMRVLVREGWIMCTFTPLRGRSAYWKFLARLDTRHATVRTVSQDEVKHISPEMVKAIEESYKNDPGQLQARRHGTPVLDSGLVFPYDSDKIWINWFQIPPSWPVVGGMDLGVGSPTVVMPRAIDPATGDRYIYACYAQAGPTAREHHFAVMDAFGDIGISMDMAGNQRGIAESKTVIDVYNEIVHGKDYRKRVPERLWKYRLVPNRSFAVGHELLVSEIRAGQIYVLKDPPGIQNYKFSTDKFRDQFEEAIWDEEGKNIKDKNEFHWIDSFRYGKVGEAFARVPGERRMLYAPIRRTPEPPVWRETLGNMRS